ncbi:hypothetical protein A2955_03380 [Candidatus Woesebacteria bacterium RIFCSPLOWO2_01_FULL_37_19]|uniref:Uncharacterized protein n=1 Tax=Candidatus Woesebacteria bacterium RIFCSPLOWO2_01_FULL_37_19 TaxID=1802514 RepID=A0A1F8BAA0_9BACT|nr:MAG: hypothetical protein A2955_03380 [Candidatus Woesebacteria bacterium RIFCSPLOWO2_01_FULL_37_19]
MSKLAIKGGVQCVPKKYQNFKHPKITKDFFKRLQDEKFQNEICSFDSPVVSDFQEEAKKLFNLKHVLPTNSGTSALFEMFYALGLEPGDEVIVPSYTFFATGTPLFVLKCIPVLVDATDNGNIDPKDIERKITTKTKAIVITHMWGIPCDMDEIIKISKKYKVPILEDASHAHGATYKGRVIGTFGVCSAWSLGAKKLITGGQGGMLGTNNKEIYQKAVLFGHANNKRIKEITIKNLLPYSVSGTGLNLRIHPFSAGVITEQMKEYPKQMRERQEVADYLISEIEKIPGSGLPRIPKGSNPSWYGFPIFFDTDFFKGVDKETFVSALNAEGATSFDVPHTTSPLTEYPVFNERGVFFERIKEIKKYYQKGDFKQTELFNKRVFKLTLWYGDNRMNYAKYHILALQKVIKNIGELR